MFLNYHRLIPSFKKNVVYKDWEYLYLFWTDYYLEDIYFFILTSFLCLLQRSMKVFGNGC